MRQTTEKEFELFKKACHKFIRMFGLLDWDIFYEHEEKEGVFGYCAVDSVGRVAAIGLNKITDDRFGYGDKEIIETAYHEIVEGLLLADFNRFASEKYVNEDTIETAGHVFTRRMENVVLPLIDISDLVE